MSDRIDIHEPIFELCHRLGLNPERVAQIVFRPADVVATVFKTDDDGQKYLGDDNEPARETLTFQVRT